MCCGEQVLCARVGEANHDAAFGSLQEIQRIVAQIRTAWPEVKIILRGDSGFCRNALMSWCENNGVDFVFGVGAEPETAEDHRGRDAGSDAAVEPEQQTGAGIYRVRLPDQEDEEEGRLGLRAKGGSKGRAH